MRFVAIGEKRVATDNIATLVCRVVADVMLSSGAQVKRSAIVVNLATTNACSDEHAS